MVLKDWLDKAAQELSNTHNIPKSEGYKEAHYIANLVLGQIVTSDTFLTDIAKYCLDNALQKRLAHMPLSKIVGRKEFYGKMFLTNEHTLDPRCETERIIDLVKIKARTVLDLGTGAGCLIICLVDKFIKAKGIAVDISADALKVAKENVVLYQLEKRVELRIGNWANEISGHFDLVVANPPYIDVGGKELEYEPAIALYGDIETYKNMIDSMREITFYQMLVETPARFADEFMQLLCEHFGRHDITKHDAGAEIFIVEALARNFPGRKN